VSVPAARVYHPPAKPFPVSAPSGPASWGPAGPGDPARREPDVLDIGDVSGSRVIETGYLPRIGLREAHAAAALEVMSRFALDPRWLLYLPPTMSPVATSTVEGLLEHPEQAFTAYRSDGVPDVLCEEKHMGSRAVLLICRTPKAAEARFGIPVPAAPAAPASRAAPAAPAAQASPGTCGAIWTRTGRPFFPAALTADLTDRIRAAVEQAGLFRELDTGWLLLDAELLPWNLKAGQLLRDQYAATGAAARASLPAAVAALEQARARALPTDSPALPELLDRTRARMTNADAFIAAYLRYCWSTDGLSGVRAAPFQLLASEGAVHHERPHSWHLEIADRLAAAAPDLIATTRRLAVDTSDPASVATATRWWEDLTAAGGEGMVA
jgi:protein phosphatase